MVKSLGASLVMLYFQLGWVTSQTKVKQSPQFLRVQERDTAVINCSYTDNTFDYFAWYWQAPGKGPTFLVAIRLSKNIQEEGRLTVHLNKDAKYFFLHIKESQPEDSGTYFCAASRKNMGNQVIFGKGTTLTVKPYIKDPQPALYQLTSPKSSDTSVCLLTDFDSSNTYTNGNDSTVLEMMTMESKSYGAVAWGSKSSFNCTNAFPQNIINLTQPSGSTCKVQDVEQSFETDKDLNLMNASLIFLRVIFLKTVGFNLLMTLRLWSN